MGVAMVAAVRRILALGLLLILIRRNRRGIVPEPCRQELAEAFGGLSPFNLRLFFVVGSSCHVFIIVALINGVMVG
jgi:hypothetical protein